MQVGNLLHKWNVENDQACNKLPTSFQLVRLVGCGLKSMRNGQSGGRLTIAVAELYVDTDRIILRRPATCCYVW